MLSTDNNVARSLGVNGIPSQRVISMTLLAFRAIADPTRQLILEKLTKSPHTLNDLAAGLPVSRPAVSQHLSALLAADQVSVQQLGAMRLYSINISGLEVVELWLNAFAWSDRTQKSRNV